MKEIKLTIDGMKCEGCVNRIKNSLSMIRGAKNIELSLEKKQLILEVKNDKVLDEVIKQIENLGFQVSD